MGHNLVHTSLMVYIRCMCDFNRNHSQTVKPTQPEQWFMYHNVLRLNRAPKCSELITYKISCDINGIHWSISSSRNLLLKWFLLANLMMFLQTIKISSTFHNIRQSSHLIENSIFKLKLTCCADTTSFCSSTSSSAFVVQLMSGPQSAVSLFIPTYSSTVSILTWKVQAMITYCPVTNNPLVGTCTHPIGFWFFR